MKTKKEVRLLLATVEVCCIIGFIMCILCVDWAAAQETGEDVLLKIITALCGLEAVSLEYQRHNYYNEEDEV